MYDVEIDNKLIIYNVYHCNNKRQVLMNNNHYKYDKINTFYDIFVFKFFSSFKFIIYIINFFLVIKYSVGTYTLHYECTVI